MRPSQRFSTIVLAPTSSTSIRKSRTCLPSDGLSQRRSLRKPLRSEMTSTAGQSTGGSLFSCITSAAAKRGSRGCSVIRAPFWSTKWSPLSGCKVSGTSNPVHTAGEPALRTAVSVHPSRRGGAGHAYQELRSWPALYRPNCTMRHIARFQSGGPPVRKGEEVRGLSRLFRTCPSPS